MQLRLIESSRDLRQAQEDLNKAVAQYGPQSEQATRAARRLADQQRQNQQLQQENVLNNIGLGLSGLTALGTLNRGGMLGRGLGRIGGIFGRGRGPALTGALRGAAGGGLGSTAARAGAGGAAAIGGLLGGSQLGRLALKAVYGEEEGERRYAGITGQIGSALGFGGGEQKIQNININTNEIGVTADDVINGSDVYG
jgi:hypothetical protein